MFDKGIRKQASLYLVCAALIRKTLTILLVGTISVAQIAWRGSQPRQAYFTSLWQFGQEFLLCCKQSRKQ